MKKTYIIPMADIIDVQMSEMIAGINTQVNFDAEKTIDDDDDIGVKRGRPSDYNVWDDDWTK